MIGQDPAREPVGCVWFLSLLGGIAFALLGLFSGFMEIRFENSGKTTVATVTQTWERGAGITRSGAPITVGDYQWTVDGNVYTDSEDGLDMNQQLTLEYLPSNPANHRKKGEHWWPWGCVSLILGVGLIIWACVAFKKDDALTYD